MRIALSSLLLGGADEARTHDLLNAIQALSQLSYGPTSGRRNWLTPRARQNSGGCYHGAFHAQAQFREAAVGGSYLLPIRASASVEGAALRAAGGGFAAAAGGGAAGAVERRAAAAGADGEGRVPALRAWQRRPSRPLRLRQISASRSAADLRLRDRASRRRLRALRAQGALAQGAASLQGG